MLLINRLFLVQFFLFFLVGCSVSNKSGNSLKNDVSDDAGLYKVVSTGNVINSLDEVKSKYKMLYFDLATPANIEKRKVLTNFAESLGRYAFVGDFNDENLQNKKVYFQKIQKIFGTSYEFYHSPFIVFLKEGNKSQYSVVDILSFSSIPNQCMKEQLDRIEARIYLGRTPKDIVGKLSKMKMTACRATSVTYEEIERFVRLLKIIISKS